MKIVKLMLILDLEMNALKNYNNNLKIKNQFLLELTDCLIGYLLLPSYKTKFYVYMAELGPL